VTELPRILASYRGAFSIRTYENETFFEYSGGEKDMNLVNILKTFITELAETVKKE
jgi:hypothetical protein